MLVCHRTALKKMISCSFGSLEINVGVSSHDYEEKNDFQYSWKLRNQCWVVIARYEKKNDFLQFCKLGNQCWGLIARYEKKPISNVLLGSKINVGV